MSGVKRGVRLGGLTDVGVVDLGEEADLWRAHGVLFWQEQFQPEDAI